MGAFVGAFKQLKPILHEVLQYIQRHNDEMVVIKRFDFPNVNLLINNIFCYLF